MTNIPYQICCDMDGVLCDFEAAAVVTINEALLEPPEDLVALAAEVLNEVAYPITRGDLAKFTPTGEKNRNPRLTEFMYRLLERDEDWWANLPWMPGGQELWAHIRQYNPVILTSPMDKRGHTESLAGKARWIEKNLGLNDLGELDTNEGPKNIIFVHNKYDYATDEEGNPRVLIDDFETKVEPFNEHGGRGILHVAALVGETIEHLEGLRNELEENPA